MKSKTSQSIILRFTTRLKNLKNTTYQSIFLLLATTLFNVGMFIKTDINSIQWNVLNSEGWQFIALGVYIAISFWGDKFIRQGETLINMFPVVNIAVAFVSMMLVKWQFDSYLYTALQLDCIAINISYVGYTWFKKRTLLLD